MSPFLGRYNSNVATVAVSIVIPCYKSENSLEELYFEIKSAFENIEQPEIIFVCDASPDSTWELIRELIHRDPKCKAFLMGRNVGQQRSTKYGISQASGKFIVTMDDDLQHDPKAILEMTDYLNSGSDLVYVNLGVSRKTTIRYWLPKVVKLVLERAKIIDNATKISAFRGFNRQIVPREYYSTELNSLSIDAQLSWKAKRVTVITQSFRKRKYGKSNYSIFDLSAYALKLVLKSSEFPMKLVSMIGIIGFFASSLLFFSSVVNYYFGNITLPGYFSTITFLSLMFSLQFLVLGILGRVLFELYLNGFGKSDVWVRESING